ncbi:MULTISPECIES: TonB-dependent receptor [unclassified Rudaea]|uniref:TonB-dependent receptor n=1 Tax=unclassified Rudaea TaxID=2627037 RepID=UPI002016482B|nr:MULTISPECIES: TonB-dependent receptor [unclassified Rudaea]
MKNRTEQRFAVSLLAGAIMASLATGAAAQTTTPDAAAVTAATAAPPGATAADGPDGKAKPAAELETVTVTGSLRSSLSSAQSIKQYDRMIVDSIIAEDIGKLPDNSVAEAIQRITGVQVAKDGKGETTTVVVRGLPNVVTTLNGNEITSGAGRGYAFQNLPATAVKAIKVYKTSDASLPDGGIAGLVDMELFQPFDFEGRKIAGTLTETNGKYSARTDPTASLLLSDRWETGAGEFGALINFSTITEHYAYNAVWGDNPRVLTQPLPDPNNPGGTIDSPIRTSSGNLISVPNAFGATYNMGYRKRPEVNYGLQWKISDELELYARGLYDWLSDRNNNTFYASFPVGWVAPTNLKVTDNCYKNQLGGSPYYGQTICDASSGSWTASNYALTSTQAKQAWGHDIQNSVGFKWNHGRLHLTGDLSQTLSSYHEENFIIDQFLKGPLTTNWYANGHTNWGLAGNPQNDPNNYYLNGLFQTWHTERGKENALRLDGVWDLDAGPLHNLQFGVRLSDHKANYVGSVEISTPPPGGPGTPANNPQLAPNPDNQVVKRLPGNYFCSMPKNPALPDGFLTGCYDYLIGNQDALRRMYGLAPGLAPLNPGRFFEIDEKKYAGYLQAAYDTELFGKQIEGVVGARLENVKRNLDAFAFNTDTVTYTPLNVKTSKPTTLPNASLIVHLSDELQARVVAAKTLTYPDFGQLNPSMSLTPGTVNRLGYGGSGNPNLKPTKSNNYDATLEWYFSPVGSLSGGVFYREIDGYIQNYVTDVVIGGEKYQLSSPQSAGRGHLAGAELAYQQTFDFLPGIWSGLGAQINYTYIDGSTVTPQYIGGPSVIAPLQNVSKNNYNVVLFYEKYDISARLAYNYRSRYIDFFTQPTVAGINDEVKPANQVDLSIAYNINQYSTIVLTATNLFGANLHQYWGDGDTRPRDIRYQDRTVALGLRFKL